MIKRTNGFCSGAGRWGSLVSFGLRVAVTTIQIRAGPLLPASDTGATATECYNARAEAEQIPRKTIR